MYHHRFNEKTYEGRIIKNELKKRMALCIYICVCERNQGPEKLKKKTMSESAKEKRNEKRK